MAVAEPVSASSLRKRANGSTMKLPPKATSLPGGSQTTAAPAPISRRIASQFMTPAERSPRYAPSISKTMAPTASTISGSAGRRSRNSEASFIDGPSALSGSLHEHRGGLGGAERPLIVVDQLGYGRCRHVEHRLRVDAERNGQHGEWPKRDDLTVIEVLDAHELRLVERAEDHLAVEPERVGGRQDHAKRGECRNPDVDLEGAKRSEEHTSESSHLGI